MQFAICNLQIANCKLFNLVHTSPDMIYKEEHIKLDTKMLKVWIVNPHSLNLKIIWRLFDNINLRGMIPKPSKELLYNTKLCQETALCSNNILFKSSNLTVGDWMLVFFGRICFFVFFRWFNFCLAIHKVLCRICLCWLIREFLIFVCILFWPKRNWRTNQLKNNKPCPGCSMHWNNNV